MVPVLMQFHRPHHFQYIYHEDFRCNNIITLKNTYNKIKLFYYNNITMINKILLILVIIIIIFFIIFDKKINDNFINYNITEIGTIGNDINIGNNGNLITIDSNKHILQANELCIGEECLNLLDDKNKSLPREDGNKGICNLDQCYDCLCPAGIVVAVPDCNKPANAAENNRIQCQACNRGYELVDEKCIPCIDEVNYNTEQRYTGRCEDCNNCGWGKYKINCTKSVAGTCVNNQCKCTYGSPKAAGQCANEHDESCVSCFKGYKMDGNSRCIECDSDTEYMKDNGNTATSCTSKTQCGANQYEIHPGDRETDRSCGNCNNYTCPLSSGSLPQYRVNCGNGAEGNCRECEACPSGQYRKNCGGNNPGSCESCGACGNGKHRTGCENTGVRVSSNTTYGSCTPNKCTCKGGIPVDDGIACPTNGDNRCKSCNDGYYNDGHYCVQCQGCGAHLAISSITNNYGYTARYHGPRAIPSNLFTRTGCGGNRAGRCQLKDNVTFLCDPSVDCGYASIAMCANSDGGGKWAKDWHWGHGHHSVYGNRQIKTSHVCGRWPSTHEVNNPNRNDGSSDADVMVYDFYW